MKKRIRLLSIVLASWFILHLTIISCDGMLDDDAPADVALIYGNKVNENGEMSPRLKARVDKGLTLFASGDVKKIIVSGGLGKEGLYEAQVMKAYLMKKGIPDTAIIVDDYGNDTYQTTINYLEITKTHRFQSVIVVSQFYHISRAKLALRRKGVKQVYGAHADYYEWRDFYSLFREFFGFYQYLFI